MNEEYTDGTNIVDADTSQNPVQFSNPATPAESYTTDPATFAATYSPVSTPGSSGDGPITNSS